MKTLQENLNRIGGVKPVTKKNTFKVNYRQELRNAGYEIIQDEKPSSGKNVFFVRKNGTTRYFESAELAHFTLL